MDRNDSKMAFIVSKLQIFYLIYCFINYFTDNVILLGYVTSCVLFSLDCCSVCLTSFVRCVPLSSCHSLSQVYYAPELTQCLCVSRQEAISPCSSLLSILLCHSHKFSVLLCMLTSLVCMLLSTQMCCYRP